MLKCSTKLLSLDRLKEGTITLENESQCPIFFKCQVNHPALQITPCHSILYPGDFCNVNVSLQAMDFKQSKLQILSLDVCRELSNSLDSMEFLKQHLKEVEKQKPHTISRQFITIRSRKVRFRMFTPKVIHSKKARSTTDDVILQHQSLKTQIAFVKSQNRRMSNEIVSLCKQHEDFAERSKSMFHEALELETQRDELKNQIALLSHTYYDHVTASDLVPMARAYSKEGQIPGNNYLTDTSIKFTSLDTFMTTYLIILAVIIVGFMTNKMTL
ncbi:hypothetical protein RCL1_005976 [Eukaryota sp. TZLM3-RCL]